MFKPEEIKKVTFEQSVFSGYKKEDVDAFLDKVYDAYSRLYSENGELVGKLKVCVSKIEEYRADEQFLKSAIVNAQKLNETAIQDIDKKRRDTETNARRQAEQIIFRAKAQAEQMIAEATEKISDFREKSTKEFAEKQKENALSLEQQERDIDAKLAEKAAELSALSAEVEAYREQVLSILECEKDLLVKLPIAKTVTVAVEEPVVEAESEIEETVEISVLQEPIPEETIEEIAITEELAEEDKTEETEATETDLIAAMEPEQTSLSEPENAEETDETDALEPEEENVEDEAEEQLSFDEVLSAPSPVEPSTPVTPVFTEEEPEEPEETPFDLFGSSPLIFPQDIPEESFEEAEPKEKSPRFRKKLKFGVDFDVKKDK